MLNCPNCGARVTGDVCEYCGTVFRKPKPKSETTLNIEDRYVELKFRGETFKCYLSNMEVNYEHTYADYYGRDVSGQLRCCNPFVKRSFHIELVEV